MYGRNPDFQVFSFIKLACILMLDAPSTTIKRKASNPCRLKADGKYCTRNSFEYLTCKHHEATITSCGNKIYDPRTQTCVSSAAVTKATYCRHRPNGDYNWPWGCHNYVICSNHLFYLRPCSRPELVYDPITDRCKHPDEVRCKEVKCKSLSIIHKVTLDK